MQSIKSIYFLLFLYLIGIIEATEQKESRNKYYIVAIKDASQYSFDIQPTKQDDIKLHRKDLNYEEPKFIPIDMDEVEQIAKSDDCYSELNDKNLNATILCQSDNLIKKGKLNVKELEKTLKPKSSFVSKQLEELAELIIDNIDTYNKDEIVNDEVHNMIRKRKRSDSMEDIFESKAFEKILKKTYTVLDVTILQAYLSDYLYDTFKDLPNVSEIIEDTKIPFSDVPESFTLKTINGQQVKSSKKENTPKNKKREETGTYYNITDIKNDTKWKKVSVEKDAYHHLSLISQSQINFDLIGEYDTNYYYPSTAGEGVDIYLIDSGINVNHVDFDTTYRTVGCDAVISNGKYNKVKQTSELYRNCTFDFEMQYHGINVASAVAGSIYGVAKKANIHMIAIEGYVSDYIAALEYIKDYAPNPSKAIINISSGNYVYLNVLDKLFNLMIRKGFMVFAAAGNDSINACTTSPRKTSQYGVVHDKQYPSSYVDVISVGSINNSPTTTNIIDTSSLYISSGFSNIGECIDIFAPGYATLATIPKNAEKDKIYDDKSYTWGTSFSSPITAGAAALIIAENPDTTYNQDLIRQTLIDLSVKGIIQDLDHFHTPNRFLNIGKLVVYSSDNKYKGCGILSGKMSCTGDNCCSKDGYCGTDEEFCEIECQSEFGKCSVNNHSKDNSPEDTEDEDKKFKNTWIYNYYNDLCLKFAPGNYLNENMVLTICDLSDEDAIWHTLRKGETQIIQDYYVDVCMNINEENIAFADSCRTGIYIDNINNSTKPIDMITSKEFPGKCLSPVLEDYDPYGITIFNENKGLRVMMDDCDVESEYQHWRLRDVPTIPEEGENDDKDEDDGPLGPIEDDDQLGPIEDDDQLGPIENDEDDDNEKEDDDEEEGKKGKLNKRGLNKKIVKKIVKKNDKKVKVVKQVSKCRPKKMKMVNNEVQVNDNNNDIKSEDEEEESLIGEAEGISSGEEEEESLIGEAEGISSSGDQRR